MWRQSLSKLPVKKEETEEEDEEEDEGKETSSLSTDNVFCCHRYPSRRVDVLKAR